MNENISWGKIGVLVVAIVGIGVVAFLWGKKSDDVTPPVLEPIMKKEVVKKEPVEVSESIIPPSYADPMIDWYSEPKKVENLHLFSGDTAPSMATYELGVIKSGDETGAILYLARISTNTQSGDWTWYFLKRKDGQFLSVKNASDVDFFDTNFYKSFSDRQLGKYTVNQKIFSIDRYSSIILKSLGYPSRLIVDGKNLVALLHGVGVQYMFDVSVLKPVLRDPYYGTVYTTDERKLKNVSVDNDFNKHKFYLRAPDGTYRAYDIDYSVIKNISEYGVLTYDLAITWNDGSKNTTRYGEGEWYADSIENEAEFRVAGKTKVGDVVYEYAENNPKLKEAYDNSLKYAKENMNGPAEYRGDYDVNMTFKDFSMSHPIVFWKDSFGRWIRFVNTSFQVDGL